MEPDRVDGARAEGEVKPEPSAGGRAARLVMNTAFSLLGRGWLLLLSLAATPVIVRRMGEADYGLYTFAGILGAYLAFLDVGVQSSTQKFVAEYAAKGTWRDVAQAIWGSALVLGGAGLLGAAVMVLATPWLAASVVKAPSSSPGTVRFVLYCAAGSFALSMWEALPTAILKGLQRFGWEAGITMGIQTLRVALILFILLGGGHIREVMVAQLGLQILGFWIGVMGVRRVAPESLRFENPRAKLRQLVSFGSWISVSRLVGPVLTHSEKILITGLVSIGALTYYAVPFNVLAATWFVPLALITAAFSTLSELEALGRRDQIRILYARVEKVLLLYILPIVFICVSLAPDVLTVWIGADFAVRGATCLRVLSVAMLFHVLGMGSYVMLLGLNRPDLIAKVGLAVMVVYVPGAYGLIRLMGLEGAAWAWLARALIEYSLLTAFAARCSGMSVRALLQTYFYKGSAAAAGLGLLLVATQVQPWAKSMVFDAVALGLFLLAYAGVGWRMMMDAEERDLVRGMWRKLTRKAKVE